MKMTTDFLDAHKRHWEDAELLFTAARWAKPIISMVWQQNAV